MKLNRREFVDDPNPRRVNFAGDGSARVFPLPFRVLGRSVAEVVIVADGEPAMHDVGRVAVNDAGDAWAILDSAPPPGATVVVVVPNEVAA